MNILVFAGTKNGRELVTSLANRGNNVFASIVSEFGADLLPKMEKITTVTGAKSFNDIVKLVNKESINLIIDSTHPYAQEIKKNIKDANRKLGITLIRYERVSSIPPHKGKHFNSMGEVCDYLKHKSGNILFTTGVNEVINITKEIDHERVYIRALSLESSKKKIKKSGLKDSHVIMKMPPFSRDENIDQILKFKIKYLVTKDSGSEGNTDEKIAAAESTNTQLIVINRPAIDYEMTFYQKDKLLDFISSFQGEHEYE